MAEQDERTCYICLDSTTTPVASEWVSPCRCAGSLAWVHRHCVLRWVRASEAATPGMRIACPQCRTPFTLSPAKGPVVSFLERFDQSIYPAFKLYAGHVLFVVFVDTACTALGILALVQVHGVDKAIEKVTTMVPKDAVSNLHYISYSLLAINYIPWETYILQALRRGSRLPVLSLVLPTDEPPQTKLILVQSLSQLITNTVLLPVCSNLFGELFFGSIKNNLARCMLGGITFFSIKGAVKMYFMQTLLVRMSQLRVLPYEPPESTSQGSQVEDGILSLVQGTEHASSEWTTDSETDGTT